MVTIYALKILSMKQMHQQSGFYLIYWGRVHCCHLSMTLELHVVHNQVIFCNQINLISTSKICAVLQQFPINKICSHVLDTRSYIIQTACIEYKTKPIFYFLRHLNFLIFC